jgi:hypothetical protein
MYSVEIDRSKRLLVISALQRVTAEQAKLVEQQVRELLRDVAPGFRVLADFRWLESMDSTAAPHVAEIMDMLAEKGVASVRRVMPDPHKDIGLNILSQFHYGPENPNRYFRNIGRRVPKSDRGITVEGKWGVARSRMFNILTSNIQSLTLERIRRPASPRFIVPSLRPCFLLWSPRPRSCTYPSWSSRKNATLPCDKHVSPCSPTPDRALRQVQGH